MSNQEINILTNSPQEDLFVLVTHMQLIADNLNNPHLGPLIDIWIERLIKTGIIGKFRRQSIEDNDTLESYASNLAFQIFIFTKNNPRFTNS